MPSEPDVPKLKIIAVKSCDECPMMSFQDESRCMHPDGPGWKVLAPEPGSDRHGFNHIEDVHPKCPLRDENALLCFTNDRGPADVVLEAAMLTQKLDFLESDTEADARVDEIIRKKNARRDFQPLDEDG